MQPVSEESAKAVVDAALASHAYWIFFGTRCDQVADTMAEVMEIYDDYPHEAQLIICTETPIGAILIASKKRLTVTRLYGLLLRWGLKINRQSLETQDVLVLADKRNEEAAWGWFKNATGLDTAKFS